MNERGRRDVCCPQLPWILLIYPYLDQNYFWAQTLPPKL
jgi:hypothetical protein